MKASVKFREDQKPLLRAKVPLSILGLPFQSGIVAGDSKELTLNLGTFFESGPSVRVAYRPNDGSNPFSLVVKTGTGSFGSPISSSMLMSAEFNLLGRGKNPSFMLHFKPQFGDFSIKKSQSSVFEKIVGADQSGSVSEEAAPVMADDAFSGKKISVLQSESPAAGVLAGVLSGLEVAARTSVPVRNRAVVSLRWGVRVPAEMKANPMAGTAFQKIPFLVMNKIGIEHVDGRDSSAKATKAAAADKVLTFPGNAEVADACFTLKRQLEALQSENGLLRKAVEDLRHDIAGATKSVSNSGNFGGRNSGGKVDWRSNGEKKSSESDVSEELKKALSH